MKYYDLHAHSNYSDGALSPKDLITKAKEIGLDGISLTDHDSVFGLPEAIETGKKISIDVIPGVEIQAYNCEILGYFMDIENSSLTSLLEKNQKAKLEHLKKRIDGLQELNVDIEFSEVEEYALKNNYKQIMGTQLAEVLIEKGYGKTIQEIYEKYLKKIRVRLESEPIRIKKVVDVINDAGGVSVLPHVWLLKNEQKENIENFITKLVKYGVSGIETSGFIPSGLEEFQGEDFITKIKLLCKDHNLIETSGSDFHGGTTHPDNKLGEYKTSEEIVKELEKRRN